ncbi:MAG: hypothetical protein HY399_08605 [Elusimicrobia bacterium]|nr:hypothetical protein [Elusimicrobiota bacterium]
MTPPSVWSFKTTPNNQQFTLGKLRQVVGVTLVELMVAMVVITIGVLGFIGAYSGISKAIQYSKSKSLASNLAQEKIETLKNITYPSLFVTTSAVANSCISSPGYDPGYYPLENVTVGDIPFQRAVLIRKAYEDGSGDLQYAAWTDADTGLKEVLVYVTWNEGGTCKNLQLRNLRDDPDRLPVTSTFSGRVNSSTGVTSYLPNVQVQAVENTSWADLTDSGGNYSFLVSAGTYTLLASKYGFFSETKSMPYIDVGQVLNQPFTLIPMSSGTLTGTAWIRNHLVISQVVASSGTHNGIEVEFIEAYNPTTFTWTSNSSSLAFKYREKQTGGLDIIPTLIYVNSSIPPQTYYLIASTSPITFRGITRNADAMYDPSNPDYPNIIKNDKDGGIILGNPTTFVTYDKLAWAKVGGPDPPSDYTETTAITMTSTGLGDGEQIVRKVDSGTTNSTQGRAYDSNNNSLDFVTDEDGSPDYDLQNSAVSQAPVAGTPALGAIVSAQDGLSIPSTAYAVGSPPQADFMLTNVATGTWTVEISSGVLYSSTSVTMTANANISLGSIILTSSTTNGYISGRVLNSSLVSPGIVRVESGAFFTNSNLTSGNYLLSVPTGTYDITANPRNVSFASLTAETNSGIVVNEGQVTSAVNFILLSGGSFTGFATINGVDPYPGVAIDAKLSGVSQGTAISESNGRFTISNLPIGLYEVDTYGPNNEAISPSTTSATAVAGSTVFVGTFTVSGGFGKITGSLSVGSSTTPIKTGVLVVISSYTIPGSNPPPPIDSTLRATTSYYYTASSLADATYSVSLPGGTYNIYAWYTMFNGTVPNTVKKNATTTITSTATATVNFSW